MRATVKIRKIIKTRIRARASASARKQITINKWNVKIKTYTGNYKKNIYRILLKSNKFAGIKEQYSYNLKVSRVYYRKNIPR